MKLKNLNVLYHDNLINITEEIENTLENHFGEVIYSDDFTDSVKAFRDIFIDLVIINIDNKLLSGKSLTKLVRMKHKELPVLLISDDPSVQEKSINHPNLFSMDHKKITDPQTLMKFLENKTELIVGYANSREKRFKDTLEHSLGVNESIHEYFKTIIRQLVKYDKDAPDEKVMNFAIMDTFLMSAYDGLKNIDANFTNEKFELLKKQYFSAKKIKKYFNQRTSLPLNDYYEKIFLLNQVEYVELIDQKSTHQEDIYTLTSKQSLIEQKIKKAKGLLSATKAPDEVKKLEAITRKLSKANVDTVHELQNAKDAIAKVHDRLEEIREEHIDEFRESFVGMCDSLKAQITDVLNILTYRFDVSMWECAKSSKAIKEFFDSSRIKGVFSSTTYLKYYLRQIDEKQAGLQTKKLIRYLQNWSQNNLRKVAIISDKEDVVERAKREISKIDASIKTVGYMSVESAIKGHDAHKFDLLLSCFDLGTCSGVDFYHAFQKIHNVENRDTKFGLLYSKTSRYRLTRDKLTSSNVRYLINMNEGWDNFSRKVMEIL